MFTDFNTWMGILSVVVTLLIGYISYRQYNSGKIPGALTFLTEQSIGLIDSIVKNFPQISITYAREKINPQVVLLKGYLINTGDIDIQESMVDSWLKLNLPFGYKCIEFRIVGSSQGNKSSAKLFGSNCIYFNLGLFRRNEYLKIEALVETPVQDNTSNINGIDPSRILTFEHRIANTSPVKKKNTTLKNPLAGIKDAVKITGLAILLVSFMIWLLPAANEPGSFPSDFVFTLEKNNTFKLVRAIPRMDNTVELLNNDCSRYAVVPMDEFKSSIRRIDIMKDEAIPATGSGHLVLVMFAVLYFLILSAAFLINLPAYRDYKRLVNIMKDLNIRRSF